MLNSKKVFSMFKDVQAHRGLKALTLGLALLAPACSAPPASQIVTNVAVKTSIQGSDDWIQASATLNTGGFQVAGINLPIFNPTNSATYGEITLAPALCSGACSTYSAGLSISLDITQISQEAPGSPLLPNGTPLPVGGLQNATTVAVPIAQTGAEIYFSFGPGVAMLGTAIPFSALDPVGQYAPGVDIFAPIQAGPINLMAGIFAGSTPKTTGIGLFIDLSSVLNNNKPTSLHSLIANRGGGVISSKLRMKSVGPSSRVETAFYGKIYELSKQGLVLDMTK